MGNIWRNDFPILNQNFYGKPLIYLDNAATSQLPVQVIDRIVQHYSTEHGNIHRGIHYLSEQSTCAVEDARKKVADFINCSSMENIIFTQGTTDSINMVSNGIMHLLSDKNALITTELEHHSNYVPWQQACFHKGAQFLVCKASNGRLDLNIMESLLSKNKVLLVAVTHVSNLTGTVNPIKEITNLAHKYGAMVLIDGAQGILHEGIDVQEIDCDFYCFSGHKILSPTGVGVLYGKSDSLKLLKPSRFGGGMVDIVNSYETTFSELPYKLEAGTPNISGIIGLGCAIDYLKEHDLESIRLYESELIGYSVNKINSLEYVNVLGNPDKRSGIISFIIEKVHPYDFASMIDKMGIAVRSGSHCAQPAINSLGIEKAVRISPAFYNTKEEIDKFCESSENIIRLLRKYQI